MDAPEIVAARLEGVVAVEGLAVDRAVAGCAQDRDHMEDTWASVCRDLLWELDPVERLRVLVEFDDPRAMDGPDGVVVTRMATAAGISEDDLGRLVTAAARRNSES